MLDPLAPIKITIVDPYASDPAIDMQAMMQTKDAEGITHLQHYSASRDPKYVLTRSGANPSWWTLEPISALFQSTAIDALASEAERRLKAFAASCTRIECGDGTRLEPKSRLTVRFGQEVCDDEFVEIVARRFGLAAIYEAGQVAMQRGQLSPEARAVFRWSRI